MEAALKDGRLADVLAKAKKLPPKAALAGEDWVKKVEARHAVEQAMAEVEAPAEGVARRQPSRAEARRRKASDDPHRCLSGRHSGARRRPALARRPARHVLVEWQGYVAETSVFRAFVILALALARRHAGVVGPALGMVEPGDGRPLPAPAAAAARARRALRAA